ncbi:MAG: hypothetical protein Kow0090_09750 [Myxococcota bacterium]
MRNKLAMGVGYTFLIVILVAPMLWAACGDDFPTKFECNEGFIEWTDNNRTECLRADKYCDRTADKCIEDCPADVNSTYACHNYCAEYGGVNFENEHPATASLFNYQFCADYCFLRQNCEDCSNCGETATAALDKDCLVSCVAECDSFTVNQAKTETCRTDCLVNRLVCLFEKVYTDSNYFPADERPSSYTSIAGVPVSSAEASAEGGPDAGDGDGE